MINSFYPVIMSKNIKKEAEFFKKVFKFKETFVSDWYISLKNEKKFEIAFIDSQHETIPEKYRKKCEGVILDIEVENVNEVFSYIESQKEIFILLKLKDEDFRQRHFIIENADGILIDIIQIIHPTEEFLKLYREV
ncbi:glyoxalase [Leptotrichia sp. OH3620_COT-345]|uniref:glyoxalase n=1 Tax=Leptotrichia sp. OH3620_COT-345 TaxID=2491048 RepID=UPI000F64AA1C|nr:glyoxalase [Leptotrichia sp. OH3620_COT-345]RRD39373.1 glyoxalase [Leptotrichia sp. OH3620_COT-345]